MSTRGLVTLIYCLTRLGCAWQTWGKSDIISNMPDEMSDWKKWIRRSPEERASINKTAKELESQGWKATGDLAYVIVKSVKASAGTIERIVRAEMDTVVTDEDEKSPGYAQENLRVLGKRTYVSPDVIQKLTARLQNTYGKKG